MKTYSLKRNPWPWAIIGFFAVFISGIVVFVAFASSHRMELVRADYYEQDIRFERQLERLNRTRTLSSGMCITYEPQRGEITVALPSAHAGRPASGTIEFYRPADASLDRRLPLEVNAAGVQFVNAKGFRAGLWNVRVLWVVDGEEFFFDRAIVLSSDPS